MQVTEMDSLCETIIRIKAEITKLDEEIDVKKASIKDICERVEQYFIETNRDDPYRSPHGTLFLRSDMSVLQPKGEKLKIVFDHFVKIYGEELAWTKMSIHNQTLKSEIKDHLKAVEERGGDPILETFPGVEPPSVTKSLQFRKKT